MTDEILTLKEVAEYLKLPKLKVGCSWHFKQNDVLLWIEEHKIRGQRMVFEDKITTANNAMLG